MQIAAILSRKNGRGAGGWHGRKEHNCAALNMVKSQNTTDTQRYKRYNNQPDAAVTGHIPVKEFPQFNACHNRAHDYHGYRGNAGGNALEGCSEENGKGQINKGENKAEEGCNYTWITQQFCRSRFYRSSIPAEEASETVKKYL